MENTIVALKGVNKWYGKNHVVKDLNLEVAEGEFLTLLGPSGCGKTTTLRMIAGFEDASSGRIEVQGESVEEKEPYQRDVNTVFQSYSLFPHMNVFDNIAYGPRIKKVPKDQIARDVEEMLRLVQMTGYEKRKPDALSGGQKQRIAIARALINHPRVLLLDEPLGALDLKLRKQMQIELKRLQKKLGITFIYVTHDQEEAMSMSDRIAVMKDGIILQIDKPMEIYDRPNCRFVADFIGESNIMSGRITGMVGGLLTVETADGPVQAKIPPARTEERGDGPVEAGAARKGPVQAGASTFTVGEEIDISVRTEYLTCRTRPADSFSLKARIRDFTNMGTVIKTSVITESGKELRISSFEQDTSLKEGQEVYLSWKPEKAVPIHKEAIHKEAIHRESIRKDGKEEEA